MNRLERVASWLLALFVLDRALKWLAIELFFRRRPPPEPTSWPTVTILQPLTEGAHDLELTLRTRINLQYPARVQQLWIVDCDNEAIGDLCQRLQTEFQDRVIHIVEVEADVGRLASKTAKLCAALPLADGELFWFVDDDVRLPPTYLRSSVPYLLQRGVGAIFGLARYVNWINLPSSMMSTFVNANALMSYVPLTYLTEPYTITGHCFALRREVFEAIGGLEACAGRIDDDHELARRVRQHGLRNVQTPLMYEVDNSLPTLRAFLLQMQRWFVMPRRLMLPYLNRYDRAITGLGSAANFIPTLILLFLVAYPSVRMARRLAGCELLALSLYVGMERRYAGGQTPYYRLPLVLIGNLLDPLLILFGLLSRDTIQWRGQRLYVRSDGWVEVMGS